MKKCYAVLVFAAIVVLVVAYYFVVAGDVLTLRSKLHKDESVYNKEMAGKCFYRCFSDYLLIINFNSESMYAHADLMKELYVDVFAKVLTCGPLSRSNEKKYPDIIFEVQQGDFSYHCVALAIEKYPNFKGYMYGNDDMIINWWTLKGLDDNKIWHGTKVVDWTQNAYKNVNVKSWIWWKSYMGIEACQNYYEELKRNAQTPKHNMTVTNLNIYLSNGEGEPRCAKGWADFFYIPHKFSQQYRYLSVLAYRHKLYLEIAVHNILRSLDHVTNFLVLDGIYLLDEGIIDYNSKAFWDTYNHQIAFIHPYKYHGDHYLLSQRLFKTRVVQFVQSLVTCK